MHTSRNRAVDCQFNLEGVVQGTHAAHIWVSDVFDGLVMSRVFTEAGVELGPHDHQLDLRFARSIGLRYIGTMTPEWAQSALDQMNNPPKV